MPTGGFSRLMRRTVMGLLVGLALAACGTNDPLPTSTAGPVTTTANSSRTSGDAAAADAETKFTTTSTAVPAAEYETTTTMEETTSDTTYPVETQENGREPGLDTDVNPLIEGLGAAASEQVWETAAIVEEIRGLQFDGLPSITVLSPDDFAARVRKETESQLEMVEVDEALYKLLGLLAPEDDLAALYGELYSEGVAGFYSSDLREMVLPRAGEEFSLLETMTLFHELVHAVTDQHFGFGPKMDSLTDAQRYDRASGLVSLVEGDATLSELLYVQSLTTSERSQLLREFAQMDAPDFSVPRFMEKALYFPYERGFDYVWNAWEKGGWQAVNDLYDDPPVSTEEIFVGAASPDTRPIELERPEHAWPEGYEEIYDYTWGFLDILLMFEQVLSAEAAVDAATGWGGGRSLVAYHQEGEVAFVWEYAGDSPGEAEELADLLYDYAVEGMEVGTPVRMNGSPDFVAQGEDYLFVSLRPEGLMMVACSDPGVCPGIATPYRS